MLRQQRDSSTLASCGVSPLPAHTMVLVLYCLLRLCLIFLPHIHAFRRNMKNSYSDMADCPLLFKRNQLFLHSLVHQILICTYTTKQEGIGPRRHPSGRSAVHCEHQYTAGYGNEFYNCVESQSPVSYLLQPLSSPHTWMNMQ